MIDKIQRIASFSIDLETITDIGQKKTDDDLQEELAVSVEDALYKLLVRLAMEVKEKRLRCGFPAQLEIGIETCGWDQMMTISLVKKENEDDN